MVLDFCRLGKDEILVVSFLVGAACNYTSKDGKLGTTRLLLLRGNWAVELSATSVDVQVGPPSIWLHMSRRRLACKVKASQGILPVLY